MCDAAAHPLSERGAAKRRGVSHYEAKHISVASGVSHYEAKHIPTDNTYLNNFEKRFFKDFERSDPLKGPRIDRIRRITNLTMRHTPAYVFIHRFAIGTATGSSFSPLREGMARQRSIDNQNDAAAHPLSERGAAKRRGVSHYESKHITMDNTNLNDFEKDFLKILSAATR